MMGRLLIRRALRLASRAGESPAVLVAAALLALVALLFQGCAPAPQNAAPPNTIEVWHAFTDKETPLFREITREFERAYFEKTGTSITVELRFVPYDNMIDKLRTSAMAHQTPDVAFVDSIKVTDLALGQALAPLDTLPEFQEQYGDVDTAREEFVEASFNAAIVNRRGETHLYGFPVQTTTVALFWNRRMFQARAGDLRRRRLAPNRPPRDWDEAIQYARVLTRRRDNTYGLAMHAGLWFNLPILNMYDVQFVDYDSSGVAKAAFNSENTAAALRMMKRIVDSGGEGGAWRQGGMSPEAGFINEKYAMIITGPWMIENFANTGLDFGVSLIPGPPRRDIEALDLPRQDIGGGYGATDGRAWSGGNLGGQTGVILRKSGRPDLAFAFLDHFTGEAAQRRWAERLGQIPVRKSAARDLDTSRYPYLPTFMTQLSVAKRAPAIPLYARLEGGIFDTELDLYLRGEEEDPAAMISKVERALESRILNEINVGASTK